VTPEAGGRVSKTVMTQFGRALKQLGIEHIAAYSPQARGRSERVFGTLQHRLMKELAMAGINTVVAVNQWLMESFMPDYNKRFAVTAEQEGSAFVADAMGASAHWLDLRELDGRRTQATGNDYHYIGLLTNSIPTLMEYNPSMSPAFFRMATRLLARSGDKQVRSVLVLRRANARILGLLGVHYVIADADEPPPLRLVQSEST
jgi:hypothetical protein